MQGILMKANSLLVAGQTTDAYELFRSVSRKLDMAVQVTEPRAQYLLCKARCYRQLGMLKEVSSRYNTTFSAFLH